MAADPEVDAPVGAAGALIAAVEAQAAVRDRGRLKKERRAGVEQAPERQQAIRRDAAEPTAMRPRRRRSSVSAPDPEVTGTNGIQFSGTGVSAR